MFPYIPGPVGGGPVNVGGGATPPVGAVLSMPKGRVPFAVSWTVWACNWMGRRY